MSLPINRVPISAQGLTVLQGLHLDTAALRRFRRSGRRLRKQDPPHHDLHTFRGTP
jgi:hypothetical protein